MNKVFIIAEVGVNHNGDYDIAIKLIDEIASSGIDAIKFQTAIPKLVMTKSATKAEYQKSNSGINETQLEMSEKIHLGLDSYSELQNYCNKKGVLFLSTPFDMISTDLLIELDLPIFKVPSGEITNLPFLRKIGKLNKKVILSTGMSTLQEVRESVNLLYDSGLKKEDLTILHCNTEYPTPMEDVNLRAMNTLKDTFKVDVGYSDHTLGIEVPIAAVALGAKVIEKHVTLDKNMEGPDHRASIEPKELKEMVKSIRNIEKALGTEKKKPSRSEIKNLSVARKSIYARTSIKRGEIFSENNLIVKRPGTAISPMHWDKIIGKVAKKDFNEDEPIEI